MRKEGSTLLKEVRSFLQEEIEKEHIPGAVIHISYQGEKLMQEAMGYAQLYPEKRPMESHTVFDLASLTKVVATLPAVLKLIEKGKIRLDDPVAVFLADFPNKQMTIRHLLTHTSGLPAHRQFYKDSLTFKQVIERIKQEAAKASVEKETLYSDLGIILLGHIVAVAAGESFETFTKKELFDPLHMNDTGFSLPYEESRFAATEEFAGSDRYKSGIVHDENAESMGGVSGHAGLFSTIQDLSHFTRMIEQNGMWNGERILSASSLDMTRKNYSQPGQEPRGLGWIMKGKGASCGDLFSENAYGHTGYTGTSIWFEPESQLHVILLTNRVHSKHQEGILRLRPRLHNLIRASL